MTGRFDQTVDFDPDPDPTDVFNLSEADGNAFVAKYAPSGELVWAEQAEGVEGRRIAVDGSGNAYVVTTRSVMFWKLDSDGNTVWSGAPDVNGLLNATDVAVDGVGDIYLSGSFSGTADFGKPGSSQSISLTSVGESDIYVAKYDPDGEVIWAQRAGAANGSDQATAISLDDSGQVYLTGTFEGSADFGTHSLVSLARGTKGRDSRDFTVDIFVTQLNASDGAFQWATRAGGRGTETGKSVTVDGSGDIDISSSDTVAALVVDVDISHAVEAGLIVTLESSSVLPQTLMYDAGDDTWRLIDSGPFIGEALGGTWTLSVTDEVKDGITGTLNSWSLTADTAAPAAASQQFAMATPLHDPTASSDTEPQHRSRRGARDEVFSRLARTERRQRGALRAAGTPLRQLQAAAIDRAMPDLTGPTRIARRTRR